MYMPRSIMQTGTPEGNADRTTAETTTASEYELQISLENSQSATQVRKINNIESK